MKTFDEYKKCERETGKFIKSNKYGFFTNLNNEIILNEYNNYRQQLGIKIPMVGLDDNQRNEFDCAMANKYKKDYKAFLSNLKNIK